MAVLYFSAKKRARSVHWMWWGIHPVVGLLALLVLIPKGPPGVAPTRKFRFRSITGWIFFIFGLLLTSMALTNLFFGFEPNLENLLGLAFSLFFVILGYKLKKPDDSPAEMRQLVGELCVRCKQPIALSLEGLFCERCSCPVHRRCITENSAEPGVCAGCGASAEAQAAYAGNSKRVADCCVGESKGSGVL
jgi:hypothetical protein